ncbi:MAG TPA: hypothetical protein IAA32_02720 [Candidatus Butyricicoccus stercorigallinarum]|nr:hypothetical protein [Candidatus Butyricicoccus stercorigallinarum]
MPHSIGLGMIGMTEFSGRILDGILQHNIVTPKHIHIVEKDEARREHYLSLGIDCTPDVSASMLRSEIMIVSSARQEFSTLLSSICGTTRGRVLVSTIPGRSCEYIQERVAKATNVVCVESEQREDGTHLSRLTYSKRFPNHMKSAVEDIFRSIGEIETVQL